MVRCDTEAIINCIWSLHEFALSRKNIFFVKFFDFIGFNKALRGSISLSILFQNTLRHMSNYYIWIYNELLIRLSCTK